jgi:hypothetical protein
MYVKKTLKNLDLGGIRTNDLQKITGWKTFWDKPDSGLWAKKSTLKKAKNVFKKWIT